MIRPLVSVIVPVYNGERFLAEALQSVIDQDYSPIDLVVVDDGSSDRSAEIIRGFAEARYFFQENSGVAAARNAGIAAANADILALLDQDDFWVPEKVRTQVEYLEANSDVGMVLTRMRTFLEPGVSVPSWLNPRLLEEDSPGLLPGTFMMRRELFDRVGPFNTSFETASDSEWLLRARRAGESLPVIDKVLLQRRVHSQNQSSQATCLSDLFRVLHEWIKLNRRKQT